MEISQTITLVFFGLLTAVLVVIGIQLALLLIELRKTLHKFNLVTDTVGAKLNSLIQPLQQISSAAVGFKTGIKAVEAVMEWVGEKRQASKDLGASDHVELLESKPPQKKSLHKK
ncbi:MAG: hypothetical protein ABIJ03_02795 [Patescibacteria group bacterium]|nr:hypothetical protein [Patescibacteria group bacterium]